MHSPLPTLLCHIGDISCTQNDPYKIKAAGKPPTVDYRIHKGARSGLPQLDLNELSFSG